jgi:hypothetical protein
VPAALSANFICSFVGFLEVTTVLYDFNPECPHSGIFLNAVTVWDDNRGTNTVSPRGEADRLAMIARGRRHDTLGFIAISAKLMQVNQTTTDFERAGRSVIFVLDPDPCADSLLEERPPILRRRRHISVNETGRFLE